MGTGRRIYKNTIYLGAAEIVSKLLQFVVMLYAARLLSKGDFGKFNFALSLSLIAIVFADLGINSFLIREISRDRRLAGKYFMNAFFVKIALAFITYFLIAAALNALNYPMDTRQIVYIIWIFAILSTFTELFYSIFRAFEMMQYDAFLKIFRMALLTAAGLYVLFSGYGIVAFSYTFVLVELVVVLAAFLIALKKFIAINPFFNFKFAKSMLKSALPFGLAFVFGSIYFYIGSVMLSKMRGNEEVAIYSAAYNLALALLFIPTVYTNAIYPVLSRYYKSSKEKLGILYEKSFKYLYIIGLPISVGSYFLAGRIMQFFYGNEYASSAIALQIISWYMFIKFLNFLLGTTLSSIDRQDKRMLGQGLTAGFNVLLNFMLIPKIGYVGAAWATFATEIFLFILYYLYVSKGLYFYNFGRILAKPLIATVAMLLVIKFAGFGLILTILVSALAYFAALYFLRAVDEDDKKIMRTIFQNERLQQDR
ncbi:flippase [Candidatus Woesearchaeota archaeon]|nr:flippase [Candidatus Woesearchaeota archaeon]